MEFRHVRTGVILGSLVALTGVGCATGQKTTMGSGDPVADRQRLMKNNGANWADIQNKVKAGNVEGVAVNAEALALHAQRITLLFPEGSLTDKSKAKPEIWQKWSEFQAAAKNLENRAGTLRDQAVAKDAAAVQITVTTFGRDACGTCHTPFRVPPPQQQPAQPRS
ncbi:MAG TPA: cytochrome c [Candidatus Binatia bacterium]|nr:cytochrome c [Candidatus Binatia bacterium]